MSESPAKRAKTTPEAGAVIDGKAIAASIRAEIKEASEDLFREHQLKPGLAVVLVGARTDSATYVRMKKKVAAELGFHSVDINFEESVTQAELISAVEQLNADPKVHGILVQVTLRARANHTLLTTLLTTLARHTP